MESVDALFADDVTRTREALGRAAYSALDILGLLRSDMMITIPDAARALGQTPPTAGAAVMRLVELGIAREVTGRSRSRAFVYAAAIERMAGTTP
jgi:Fic family protein